MTEAQENDIIEKLADIRDLLKQQIEMLEKLQPTTKITVVGSGGKSGTPSLKGIDAKADFTFGEEHN